MHEHSVLAVHFCGVGTLACTAVVSGCSRRGESILISVGNMMYDSDRAQQAVTEKSVD